MHGVIVVNAGRIWSTNLGCDAHLHDHCLGYRHNYLLFYQLPNSNLFTHRLLFFSREATSEAYGPRVSFSYYLPLRYNFLLLLFLDLLNKKPKNTLLQFILIYFIWRSIYQSTTNLPHVLCLSWGTVPWKGLTTPLTRRVARCCYLCAGAVYVVLLGSPTGLITMVSYLREIPTAAVLHHPFLFWEILT